MARINSFAELAKVMPANDPFYRLAEEGAVTAHSIMSLQLINPREGYTALKIICHGQNWQKIAYALAVAFHGKTIGHRKKASGYERLREIVCTCVANILEDEGRFPPGFEELQGNLFKRVGLPGPAPWLGNGMPRCPRR